MNTRHCTTDGRLIRKSRYFFGVCLCLFLTVQSRAQAIPVWKLEDLKKAVERPTSPVIINFWATFCKLCIEELPHFQKLAARYKASGVELILVSLDLADAYPKKIAAFKKRVGITSKVVWLNESNADVFCPAVDSSWSGVIPATLFFNPQTGYRKFYEEELPAKKVEAEIKAMLKPNEGGIRVRVDSKNAPPVRGSD